MSNPAKPAPGRPAWRRVWKPAVVAGAGGTAIAVWLDEVLMFAEEIIGLILLPILAGAIYLLDILMFRSRMPRQDDLDDHNDKGANQ
jgi:hypothetical protein